MRERARDVQDDADASVAKIEPRHSSPRLGLVCPRLIFPALITVSADGWRKFAVAESDRGRRVSLEVWGRARARASRLFRESRRLFCDRSKKRALCQFALVPFVPCRGAFVFPLGCTSFLLASPRWWTVAHLSKALMAVRPPWPPARLHIF